MFCNLFHRTPKMISDSFLATWWETPGAMRILSNSGTNVRNCNNITLLGFTISDSYYFPYFSV